MSLQKTFFKSPMTTKSKTTFSVHPKGSAGLSMSLQKSLPQITKLQKAKQHRFLDDLKATPPFPKVSHLSQNPLP